MGRKRIPKENRQNLKMWAEGARESVLRPHIEPYTDALNRKWRDEREYLQSVCNEFHARISWRLKDHEEPELPLPEYDPRAPAPVEDLDEDELQEKRARVQVLNKRIQRWLKYRARRLNKTLRTKLDPRNDPWAILLAKLSGLHSPPKARQAFQQFMHENYQSDIADVVAERWAEQQADGSNLQTKKSPDASFRAKIARELFGELSDEEREGYAERAKEEAAAARKVYEDGLKNPPSRTPEDRQKAIDLVGSFLGPIVQGILERTGLHTVVLMGGPIPKYGGELKTSMAPRGLSYTQIREWNMARNKILLEPLRDEIRSDMDELLGGPRGAGRAKPSRKRAANEKDGEGSGADVAPRKSRRLNGGKGSTSQASLANSATQSQAPSSTPPPASTETQTQPPSTQTNAPPSTQPPSTQTDAPPSTQTQPPPTQTQPPPTQTQPPPPPSTQTQTRPPSTQTEPPLLPSTQTQTQTQPPSTPTEPPLPPSTQTQTRPPSTQTEPPLLPSTQTQTQPPSTQTEPPLPQTQTEPPLPPSTQTQMQPPPPPSTQLLAPTPPPPPATQPPASRAKGKGKAKKAQAATSTTLPPPPGQVTVPANAPPWLRDGILWLRKNDLGPQYAALLSALVRMEGAFGFDPQTYGALPSDERPSQVGDWINRGRSRMKKIPGIADVGRYAEQWQTWWDSMQPGWRRRGTDGKWRSGGDEEYGGNEEWGVLDRPGPNGCLSVVAALYFWGVCENQSAALKARWREAVEDVVWVLEGLEVSMAASK
ncbi:hypothetical protein DFH06DRAFT_1012065 [Mycena polygramma]|nr:hypothetical protein DFH06DRAFT_1012065 [Mycena polygramma]